MSDDERKIRQLHELGLSVPKVTKINGSKPMIEKHDSLAETIEVINEAKVRIETGGTGEGAGAASSRDDDIEALTRAQIAAAEKALGYHD